MVGLLIGAGIGASSSVGVANKLLETEIESTQTQMQNIESNFGGDMGPGGPGMQGDNQGGPGGPGNEKKTEDVDKNSVDNIQKEAKTENETAEKTNNTKKIETDQGKMVLDLFDGKYVE